MIWRVILFLPLLASKGRGETNPGRLGSCACGPQRVSMKGTRGPNHRANAEWAEHLLAPTTNPDGENPLHAYALRGPPAAAFGISSGVGFP
jgi:hypothetical protein